MNRDDVIVQSICVPKKVQGTAQDLCHAVAEASVTSLLERSGNDEYWSKWLSGAFTKSVRRVRSVSEMNDLVEIGTLASSGDSFAVALTPMPYSELPRAAARSQVQGLILPLGLDYDPESVHIVLDAGVSMSSGKAAAQAAHALMKRALIEEWTELPEFSVAFIDSGLFRNCFDSRFGIVDSGLTELEGPTPTAMSLRT